MIEVVILNQLNRVFRGDLPLYMERPQNPPAEYALLQMLPGRGSDNGLSGADYIVTVYAASLFRVAELGYEMDEALRSLEGLEEISSAEVRNGRSIVDTQTKTYKWESNLSIFYYRE